MTYRLSRVALLKPRAEEQIDKHFAVLMADEIGPLGDLHARKRYMAENGGGPLVDGDEDRRAILDNAYAQDRRIASLEVRRRQMKAEVRSAGTAEEVKAIIDRLSQ